MLSKNRGIRLSVKDLLTTTLILGLTAVAIYLRFFHLGEHSFRGDEILSVQRAQFAWKEFWNFIAGAPPPAMVLYYILLRPWVMVVGDGEIPVRMLSAGFGVGSVLIMYVLGKRMFGTKIGLIGMSLLAVNAFHIQYSQDARSYSLVVLAVIASSLFWVRSIEQPSRWNWTGYVLTSTIAVYTHPFSLLVLVSHVGSLLFLRGRPIPLMGLYWSGLALGIALLPILAPVYSSVATANYDLAGAPSTWIPSVTAGRILNFGEALTGQGGMPLLIAYLISASIGCVLSIRVWLTSKASSESWKYALLLMWLLVPIIITLGYSFLISPALVSRYLLICLPPLALLAALGIVGIPGMARASDRLGSPRHVALLASAVLLVVVTALSAKGVYAYFGDFQKEDWRGVASYIKSGWQAGDGVLVYIPGNGFYSDFPRYYLEKNTGESVEIEYVIPVRSWLGLLGEEPNKIRVSEYLPDYYNSIWLVLSRDSDPEERVRASKAIQDALSSKYQTKEVVHFEGRPGYNIRVVHYSNPIPGVFGGGWESLQSRAWCHSLAASIVGTDGEDIITGTPADDVIHGLSGNDVITGLQGNDTICGGIGNDHMEGGEGADYINGADGNDELIGGAGDDHIFGNVGNDIIVGESGNDMIAGGPGADDLDGGEGFDLLNGEDDDDFLRGGQGDDVLNSGLGSNILDGGLDSDACRGRGENRKQNCEAVQAIATQQGDAR